jgi:hypothetical protein
MPFTQPLSYGFIYSGLSHLRDGALAANNETVKQAVVETSKEGRSKAMARKLEMVLAFSCANN